MARRLGIDHLLHKKPFRLSGGERQRVAILRALVTQPKLILADEPTGNLDDDNSQQVKKALLHFQKQMGYALLVVTHDSSLLSMGQRRYLLRAGGLHPVETTG
jgi:lipoprotein-releasing system ATP-binding protein